MGYRVPKTNYGLGWKVKFESYEGKRSSKDIPKTEYARLGFNEKMTREEAKAKAKTLNAQEEVKRIEAKRRKIADRMKLEETVLLAYLPETEVRAFEREVLFNPEVFDSVDERRNKKFKSHWKAAQKAMAHIQLDPTDWCEHPQRFFDYFAINKISYSYVRKITRLLNMWGQWQCRKKNIFFQKLDLPKGKPKLRIAKEYFKKHPGGLASDPLTWTALNSAQNELKPEQWNWLYLTVWFGLRPEEADSGNDKEIVHDTKLNLPALKVYQPKLASSLPYEQCFKFIPCKYPEQLRVVDLLKNGKFARPLVKTVQGYFGERVNLKGGRKNFEEMMLERDEDYKDISLWLGHQSVDRTWKDYRNRKATRYKKAA